MKYYPKDLLSAVVRYPSRTHTNYAERIGRDGEFIRETQETVVLDILCTSVHKADDGTVDIIVGQEQHNGEWYQLPVDPDIRIYREYGPDW